MPKANLLKRGMKKGKKYNELEEDYKNHIEFWYKINTKKKLDNNGDSHRVVVETVVSNEIKTK